MTALQGPGHFRAGQSGCEAAENGGRIAKGRVRKPEEEERQERKMRVNGRGEA